MRRPVAGRQHQDTESEGRDHLEQEQPADRRDRPVAGQIKVKVNRTRRDQQPAPGQPKYQPCPCAHGWPPLLRYRVLFRQPAVTRPLSTRRHRNPMIIAESQQYLRDFSRIAAEETTAADIVTRMVERYPNWENLRALS